MMVRRDAWEKAGGPDESFSAFPAFPGDVDLSLRLRRAGFLVVWTPEAELCYTQLKEGESGDMPGNRSEREEEAARFRARWAEELKAGDPYYNPNLSLFRSDFALNWKAYEREWKQSHRQ